MTPGVPQPENGFCAQYAQCALYSVHRYSVKTIIGASDAIFIGDQVGDQLGCQPHGATGGWLQAECADWGIAMRGLGYRSARIGVSQCADWGIAVRWYIGPCDGPSSILILVPLYLVSLDH
jgi:hypothetical protein